MYVMAVVVGDGAKSFCDKLRAWESNILARMVKSSANTRVKNKWKYWAGRIIQGRKMFRHGFSVCGGESTLCHSQFLYTHARQIDKLARKCLSWRSRHWWTNEESSSSGVVRHTRGRPTFRWEDSFIKWRRRCDWHKEMFACPARWKTSLNNFVNFALAWRNCHWVTPIDSVDAAYPNLALEQR